MKFVSKDLALKLKEKGFNRPCFGWYNTDDEILKLHLCEGTSRLVLEHPLYCEYIIDAPTTDQVLEWLREEKKIYFNIFPYHFTGGIYCILNSIWQVNMDIKFGTKEYDINIPYENYEDACIAGIEYVVEHLI